MTMEKRSVSSPAEAAVLSADDEAEYGTLSVFELKNLPEAGRIPSTKPLSGFEQLPRPRLPRCSWPRRSPAITRPAMWLAGWRPGGKLLWAKWKHLQGKRDSDLRLGGSYR